MLLAWYAFLDKCMAICLHDCPEVAGSENSGGHGSRTGVISAYAFMQFSNYVLGLLDYDAFEECLIISTLV